MYLDLAKYTTEELKALSVEFLAEHISPYTLLNIWSRLPIEYKNNFYLQTQLPCFIHYNRPDQVTHIDGPPPSQARCRDCLYVLHHHS